MKNILIVYYCLCLVYLCPAIATDFNLEEEGPPPLFVSLGCTSKIAFYLKTVGIINAFPLDWLLTTDGSGLISLIQDDFAFFLDKRYLTQDLDFDGVSYRVLNTYYNIDFRHDWHDIDIDFEEYLPKIQEKYQRLIEKFRQLDQYTGKVYFIRSAFPADWSNPNFFSPLLSNESNVITYSHAEALKNALEQRFPNLDFTLIVINHIDEPTPDIVGIDRLIEFKVRKMHPDEDFLNIYKVLKEEGNK